jgi:hypothetical protein
MRGLSDIYFNFYNGIHNMDIESGSMTALHYNGIAA